MSVERKTKNEKRETAEKGSKRKRKNEKGKTHEYLCLPSLPFFLFPFSFFVEFLGGAP